MPFIFRILACVLLVSATASGQDTRDEQRAAEQAEKAKVLHPSIPGRIERYSEALEKALLNPPPIYTYIRRPVPRGRAGGRTWLPLPVV
jgi:hypothetical protein